MHTDYFYFNQRKTPTFLSAFLWQCHAKQTVLYFCQAKWASILSDKMDLYIIIQNGILFCGMNRSLSCHTKGSLSYQMKRVSILLDEKEIYLVK